VLEISAQHPFEVGKVERQASLVVISLVSENTLAILFVEYLATDSDSQILQLVEYRFELGLILSLDLADLGELPLCRCCVQLGHDIGYFVAHP